MSPSFAAPAVAPAIHDQGLRRLTELTGLIPVEYPTTRRLDATAQDRAADLNTAFADPSIRAVLATIGGEDQITVVPLLDPEVVKADPKPFLGYSDNTNLLNWLWTAGVAGFYGGSTQVHLGAGPVVRRSAGCTDHRRTTGNHRAGLCGGLRPRMDRPGGADRVRQP